MDDEDYDRVQSISKALCLHRPECLREIMWDSDPVLDCRGCSRYAEAGSSDLVELGRYKSPVYPDHLA